MLQHKTTRAHAPVPSDPELPVARHKRKSAFGIDATHTNEPLEKPVRFTGNRRVHLDAPPHPDDLRPHPHGAVYTNAENRPHERAVKMLDSTANGAPLR